MADQVQATLDRMVPALRDLLDRGIFTETEIKAIVSRRRESEYLLYRVAPRKTDYQRYIEAERNLEKLRALRKKMVFARYQAKEREKQENGGENNDDEKDAKGKGKPKSSFGDGAIVQHIHLLFIRAKRKWKDDLSWHLQHAEFAKEAKSYQMLSRIYAEALQIHPRNESLWVEAASHEYFGYENVDESNNNDDAAGGGSIKSARVLLQRGLRINSQAQNLWLQSFCLELHYIQKLRGRREILSLENSADAGDKSDNSNEGTDELESSLKLPHIIYKNAIKSIPSDVSFRMKFVEQCKLFPKTKVLVRLVIESIEQDFQSNEEAWITRTQLLIDNNQSDEMNKGFMLSNKPFNDDDDDDDDSADNNNTSRKRKREELGGSDDIDEKVIKTLNDAVNIVQTPKMYVESLVFLKRYIAKLSDLHDNDDDGTKSRMAKLISTVIQQINMAENAVAITAELAIEMSTILYELGLSDQSLQLIKRLTDENPQCKENANCWLKIVEISEQGNIDQVETKTIKSSIKLLRKALRIVPMYDSGYIRILSQLFINLLTIAPKINKDDELFITYEQLLLLYQQNEETEISLPAIALAYLRYSKKKDVKIARKVYQKLLFHSNSCENLLSSDEDVQMMRVYFDECLELEESIKTSSKSKTKQQKQLLNNLYNAASKLFQTIDEKLAHSYFQKRSESVF